MSARRCSVSITNFLNISILFTAFTVFSTAASANEDPGVPVKQLYKIDQNGERLPEDSSQWECVEDADTSLFWQKRSPASALHNVHDTYSWYQPASIPSGQARSTPEQLGIDASCNGYRSDDPSTFCNTDAYIKRINQTNYCGFSDWRLPTSNELLSLVDPTLSGRPHQSAIDLQYFPFNNPFAYWTDTVNESGVVLTVIRDENVLANSLRSDHLLIRLVRGN